MSFQPKSEAMKSLIMPFGPSMGEVYKHAAETRDLKSCFRCQGTRWWSEATHSADNWRCGTCHPPMHLSPEAIREKDPQPGQRPLCVVDKAVEFRTDEPWRKRFGVPEKKAMKTEKK